MLDINFIGVLLAAVASMGLGFFWYSPVFLGKPWMKEKGYTEKSLKAEQAKMGPLYGLSFVLALIMAYMVAHVMQLSMATYHYAPVATGITTGFFVWLGFIGPVMATGQIFGSQNWRLWAIDAGYQLASVVLMGVVLGLMD